MVEKGLKGKVAIVTGGSKGIGKGVADMLSSEGVKIVVADLAKEKSDYFFVQCDVSKMGDCKNVVDQAVKKFGRVDILVNNAGIYPFVTFQEMSEEQWDKVMNVNLKGVFNCTKAVLPYFQKQKSGKIVNIASIAGAVVGFNNLVHYCASKGGVLGFTRAAALELAPNNIQVNAIAPGGIVTPGVGNAMEKKAQEAFAQSVPAKRMGLPEDIAGAVKFLSSNDSDYVTGQLIVVDGGLTVQ